MPRLKNRKIFLYIFLLLFIGTINNKNLDKSLAMNISEIVVTGLEKKDSLDLVNNLKFLEVENLFFLKPNEIKKIVEDNNLVERYKVFKEYPTRLIIEIKKTDFLAQTRRDGNFFFLGSNGAFIKTSTKQKNIPFIFGDFKNSNFFELKRIIDDSTFKFNEIKNLFFFKSGRWDIETSEGLMIRLPKDNLEDAIKLLIDFLDQGNENINTIDLRQKNQIVIDEK
jgi:cell division protein FtsQ